MPGQGFSWILQFYLLFLLVRPLDPSSQPERDTSTLYLLPEELEQQDVDPEPTPWVNVALVSWTALLVELLTTGVVLGWYFGRRLWRWWREKHQSRSALRSARAGRCCCGGRGCSKNLIQLLRHNRAMLRLCLRYCPQQRPRAKRAAKEALWKRRRLQLSPQR